MASKKTTAPKKAELSEKRKKIEELLAPIRKQFGAEAINFGLQEVRAMEVIPTGSLELDKAIGVGGIPVGRIIEIYGPESSGKTTITLHIIAEAQKKGVLCAFIDAEHALDLKYAERLGVNVSELLISQPSCGEEGLEIADSLVKSGAVGLVIVDSVAALTPKAEIEGDMGDSHMGLQARMMSQAMRKLTGSISKTKCTVVFINQIRMKIGVMFGSPETTTGGNALKFYASVRMAVRAGEKVKKDDVIIGGNMVVKIAKNKVAPPFREATIPVRYGEGFDKGGEVYLKAIETELITKGGGTHYYNDKKIASSKDECLSLFNEKSPTFNKELFEEIKAKVLASYDDLPESSSDESSTSDE